MTARRAPAWTAFAVAAAAFAAFWPALSAGWVNWDDDANFLLNPHYRGLGWAHLRWMFTTLHMGPYQPLSWLTLAVDHALWGMDARGYHLTNVALHALNAALFFRVAAVLLGGLWPAALAALLFAAHPLRVESVAWITERRDVLSGAFFLVMILCYLRARDGRRPRLWLARALAAFAAALLSKAIVVTAPLVLLLLDVHLGRLPPSPARWGGPESRAVLREKLPFFALAFAFGLVGLAGQKLAGGMRTWESYGLLERLGQSAYAVLFYLGKTLAPAGLSPIYELPRRAEALWPQFAAAAVVVAAATSSLFALRRRWPAVWLGWLYYLATLAPVLGVVQFGPQLAADRYTYLPSLGLCLLAAAAAKAWAADARRRAAVVAASIAAVGTLSGLCWRQTSVWRDSGTLWAHALRVDPRASNAHINLGLHLADLGALDQASERFSRAIELDPGSWNAHAQLGRSLALAGRPEAALPSFERAVELAPRQGKLRRQHAAALLAAGRPEDAFIQLREAVAHDPRDAAALHLWGDALARLGRHEEALSRYREALRASPDLPTVHNNMASVLLKLGRRDEAIAALEAAVARAPDYAVAKENLAGLLAAPPTRPRP